MKTIRKVKLSDIVIAAILGAFAFIILVPFLNVIAVSFTTQKEYLETPLLLFPKSPTLHSYKTLVVGGSILVGYRTTILMVAIGVPLNMFLTTSMAYGMSRKNYPGRKFLFFLILFTMIFHGGIIPLYILMMKLNLINTIWAVILAYGINTFYMIIMRTYISSLPESLLESAKLDGAGEWRILLQIVLPMSAPIIATVTLFYTVDRWNEWYNSLIFIRKSSLQPLQLVLRAIVIESEVLDKIRSSSSVVITDYGFTNGLKMAAVVFTMAPIMCIFPFTQKYFVKGIMVGAIKS